MMHESLNDEGSRFVAIKTSTHEVVHLIGIERSTGCTMSGRNFVGKHLKFGYGFCSGLFGQKEILEHLTSVAMVGFFGNGQQTGGDGMTSVVACCVNVE